MDKSLLTNVLALAIAVAGFLLPAPWQAYVLNAGLFALSGGVTNWLAVHMLFERIPGFYGSGVIQLHFESFKNGIRDMIMQQFFNPEAIERFWLEQSESQLEGRLDAELRTLLTGIDFDRAFDSLADSIMQSSLGNMLGMFGGRAALDGLREPFSLRMREHLQRLLDSGEFRERLKVSLATAVDSERLYRNIENLVDLRLAELTPTLVKQIVQSMIREHLGWLVVWGAVIGGIVGLVLTAVGAIRF